LKLIYDLNTYVFCFEPFLLAFFFLPALLLLQLDALLSSDFLNTWLLVLEPTVELLVGEFSLLAAFLERSLSGRLSGPDHLLSDLGIFSIDESIPFERFRFDAVVCCSTSAIKARIGVAIFPPFRERLYLGSLLSPFSPFWCW
jgi:hypothetical protein